VWNWLLCAKFEFTRAVPRAYRVYRNRYRHRKRVRSGYEITRRRKHASYLKHIAYVRQEQSLAYSRSVVRERALRSVWCCKCHLQLARWIIYGSINGEVFSWLENKIRPGEQVITSPKERPKRNPDHLYVWWDGRGHAYFRNPHQYRALRQDCAVEIETCAPAADVPSYRWRVPESIREWLNVRGIHDASVGAPHTQHLRPWCATCYDKRRMMVDKHKK